MWSLRYLSRIDLKMVVIIQCLMGVSLLIISSYSRDITTEAIYDGFITKAVQSQIQAFLIGWAAFLFFSGFDYNKLREWTWILYIISLISLIGLFFTSSIQGVHRWYRVPFLPFNVQPSEYAKLATVIALSWYLERKAGSFSTWGVSFGSMIIAGIPFLLVLKQPDLGTALVFYPMTLVIFYFGNLHPVLIRILSFFGVIGLVIVALFFTGVISHQKARPYALKVLKEYQYERLNPDTHHQKSSAIAIGVGGLFGVGWNESEYARGGSLPTPHTDSAFSSFGEEFGLVGLFFLLVLFYLLVYRSFQVAVVAKDLFARLLAAGISVFIAVPILANIAMMCGLLPITGVPLLLVSYGGSSVVSTMIALGILQSIYSRRFMF